MAHSTQFMSCRAGHLIMISLSICMKVMWLSCYVNGSLHLQSGPSCSKLTMSLVNDSLKF